MAFKIADFVRESTLSAPGTGTITLGGAASGRRGFGDVLSSGDTSRFVIDDGTQAEVFQGTFTAGANDTISRDTVLDNTDGTTSPLNFTGSAYVYFAPAAAGAVVAGSGVAGPVYMTSTGKSVAEAASQSAGRSALGLGTMATQAASAVAVTGGTLDGVTINNSAVNATTLTNQLGGATTLNSYDGVTITHNWGSTDYVVMVIPHGSPGDAGEITVVKASNTVTIYNSGTPRIAADYMIFGSA